MACGSALTRTSLLPVIGQSFRTQAASSQPKGKLVKQPSPPSHDFHCPDCGLTKANYPNYRHKCPGAGSVSYQLERTRICNACPHNRDGVCMPLKTRQKDLPCLVEIGIKLPGVQCPLKRWPRVMWRCDSCGSTKFDENGLNRCPVCHPSRKPTLVQCSAFNEAPLIPSKDFAIISMAIGQNTLDQSKITFPRFKEYADFVGADFIEITNNLYPKYPLANKFRVGNLTRNYKRVIFLDVDVWLKSGVGNLFDQFESGSVWMHPDQDRIKNEQWSQSRTAAMEQEQGITCNASKIYNTGVVIFDRAHSSIWSPPPKPMGTNHVSEQFWIEHQAIDVGVKSLPWQYNCQWYWTNFDSLIPDAKIVHLANCPHTERLTRLKKLAAQDEYFT